MKWLRELEVDAGLAVAKRNTQHRDAETPREAES
jgi:hypothetical protein